MKTEYATDTLGGVTATVYDNDGHPLKRIDQEGKALQMSYDAERRLASTTDGAGNRISYAYGDGGSGSCSTCAQSGNSTDQPVKITFPTFVREFGYDARGRKVEEREIAAGVTYTTSFTYDLAGNLLSKTDPAGRSGRYEYDALNRLVRSIDAEQVATLFTYDNRDNLLSLTDGNTNVTRFSYDRANRLLTETRPDGQVTSYSYDLSGRLATKIDPLGNRQRYHYDPAGQLVKTESFAAADLQTPVKTVTYSYDAAGRLTGYDDGVTGGSYSYDALGRKSSEAVSSSRLARNLNKIKGCWLALSQT